MDPDEITFDDLLDDEPAASQVPQSYEQLHADGFPRGGGLAALAAIQTLEDPGSRFVSLRTKYRQLLELQQRETARSPGPASRSGDHGGPPPAAGKHPTGN
jgi:hypothetical protein